MSKTAGRKVAVVGATGAVGQRMLKLLAERRFPADQIVPLASGRSAGSTVTFDGKPLIVQELTESSFSGIDLALFSAGSSISERFAPIAAQSGAWVVDNTSFFRMHDDVPLVVPEINKEAAFTAPRRIIANPNCSTIQMVVALEPLRQVAGLRRIVVSTYQSVSGAGQRAIGELGDQMRAWSADKPLPKPQIFSHTMLFECLPQIGDFRPDGYSVEERKMIDETRKIFDLPELAISATAVRVPVLYSHSEAVNVEFERPLSAEQARSLLAEAAGVEVIDEPRAQRYPLARKAAETDPVYVGRIRQDPCHPNTLDLWIVADNLRKGAALNAIQIGELLVERNLL
ncbi:MAG: aspartate-semialdehyde dehydrogenase [Deltaproteobacteria bacterium]|nr:aspartate-semialdehyde dehydrogenase [Deltaproteobacteria bacterium]